MHVPDKVVNGLSDRDGRRDRGGKESIFDTLRELHLRDA
jgi:hypothetical protein